MSGVCGRKGHVVERSVSPSFMVGEIRVLAYSKLSCVGGNAKGPTLLQGR